MDEKSLKTGLLNGTAPKDGSPVLPANGAAKAWYIWSRGALCTGLADGHHTHHS